MPVSVYFFGLICHINEQDNVDDLRDFAAVVKAPGHEPTVFWLDDSDKRQEAVLHDDVHFSITEGQAIATDTFKEYVPRLREDRLTKGKLTPATKNKDKTNVHSYIHYPAGGELYTSLVYEQEAIYVEENADGRLEVVHQACVARLTRLQVPAEAELKIGRLGIRLTEGRPALILNADFNGSALGEVHSKHFARLLDGTVADALDGVNRRCVSTLEPVPDWILGILDDGDRRAAAAAEKRGERAPVRPETVRVECGNTNWP